MMRSNRKGRITVMNLLDHPVQLIVFLFLLSVLPLLVILGTSFLKISVVLALLRKSMTVCSRLTGVLSNSIRRRAKSGFLWRLDDAPGPNTTKSGSMRVLYGC